MAFETEGLLSFDASDYVSGASEASDASEDLADSTDEAADSLFEFDAGVAAAGAAALGAGTAMQSLFDETQELNESLGRTGVSMEMTTEETRDLATSMSDATFPIDDVTTTMDALAQVGVDTEEEMREVAEASDNLADATGTTATEVAEGLAPAVQALDGDLSAITDDADAFTEAVRNTGLEMSDVSSTIERLDFDEVEELGLSAADTAELIGEFGEESGFTGRQLRTNFRSAIEDADGSTENLVDELGLGEEAMESLADETSAGSESTTEFADAANDSLTTTDELRSTFDDLRLQASGMLGPIDAAAPALQGLGVAALALSTINFSAVIPSIAGVVTAAAPLLPVLLGLTAVGGTLAWLFGDEILDALEAVTGWISDELIPPIVELAEDGFEFLIDVGEDLVEWFDDAFGDEIQDVVKEAGDTIDTVAGRYIAAFETIQRGVDAFTTRFDSEIEALQIATEFYFSTIRNVVETTIANLIDAISIGLSLIRGDWEGALDGIESITTRSFGTIETIVGDAFAAVDELTGGTITSIRETLEEFVFWLRNGWELLTAFTAPFRAVADRVVGNSIVPNMISDIQAALTGLTDWLAGVWSLHPLSDTVDEARRLGLNAIGEFVDTGEDVLGSLAAWVRTEWTFGSDLLSSLRSTFSSALSSVRSFVESVNDALDDIVTDILINIRTSFIGDSPSSGGTGSQNIGSGSQPGSATGNMPGSTISERGSQRRAFAGVATGGFIEGDGLAVLHDGERVLPETQVTDRGEADVASGSGVTIENLTVNANDAQDGRRAGKAFRDELRRFNI